MDKIIKVGNVSLGNRRPFVLIAGPCVIESRDLILREAETLVKLTKSLKVPFIFKASYDKANRTSIKSFRGPGLEEGLKTLAEVKATFGCPVLSDVHTPQEIPEVSSVIDILQIPAFLCRQTDLLIAAAKSGRVVNVKKGQFLAPWDMKEVVTKIEHAGNHRICLTERGSSFGYNTLVTDFRSLSILAQTGYPVILDASHSVQQPGGMGSASGGKSEFIPLLARCGVAAGVAGVFMEVHPDPSKALSDGPNMLKLAHLPKLLKTLVQIDTITKRRDS